MELLEGAAAEEQIEGEEEAEPMLDEAEVETEEVVYDEDGEPIERQEAAEADDPENRFKMFARGEDDDYEFEEQLTPQKHVVTD